MKKLGIHREGGLVWVPRGKYKESNSVCYKAKIICPYCGNKRWIAKTLYQSTLAQGREFTRVCKKCRGLSRRKKTGFSLFKLIDDKTFSVNLRMIGDYNRACPRGIKKS